MRLPCLGNRPSSISLLWLLATIPLVLSCDSGRHTPAETLLPAGSDTGEAQSELAPPAKSPSGRIAFASVRDPDASEWALYVIETDGTGEQMLMQGTLDDPPAWSPDGTRIACAKRVSYGHTEIFLVEVQSGEATQLTHLNRNTASPAWSPDGTCIVFACDKDGDDMFDMDLWAIDSDGGNLRRLTHMRAPSSNPAWSPDGEEIAFMYDLQSHEGPPDIYIVDADGSNLRNLTNSPLMEAFPAWAPDGRTVYFTSGTSEEDVGVYRIRTDGTGRERVTCGVDRCGQASVSPDGEWLAVVGGQFGRPSEVYLVHLETGTSRPLTHNAYDEECPTWSPACSAGGSE